MNDGSIDLKLSRHKPTAAVLFCAVFSCLAAAQSELPEFKQSDPISDYLNAIELAESQTSAYSTELAELYLGLGNSHFSRKEYEPARQAFQRGMQIERVNYGLHSLSQTPYLMSIAETESYLGNWDKSQQALENLYLINAQAYGENDPRMLPVLDELLDWYLTTYSERPANGGYQNLLISEKLGDRMYNILQQTDDLGDPEVPQLYRKLSHLHFFIADHLKEHGEPAENGFSFNSGATVSSANTTSRMHYQRGEDALQKVIESLEQQDSPSALDQANAMAELGDWYLVFGQRGSANKAYDLAYQSLEGSEQTEQLQQSLFGEAKLIDFTQLNSKHHFSLAANNSEQTNAEAEELEISVTISEYGVPKNIEVLNAPENLDKKTHRKIINDIRGTRYRPKLINGQAISSSIIFPYPSPHQSQKIQG
jgi:tetratricopeptide (TPR) repeat protein